MPTFTRNQRLLIRVVFYLAILAGLYLLRGGVDWQRIGDMLGADGPDREVRLAGRELAPALVDSLLLLYRRDYPEAGITLLPGNADRALEHLLNGRCDVALQTAPPSAATQAMARAALGDTLDWHPIALAALELWSASPEVRRVDTGDLRALLTGHDAPGGADRGGGPAGTGRGGVSPAGTGHDSGASAGAGRLVAEAPTRGTWDAFARALDLEPEAAAASPRVRFVADAAAVLDSLAEWPEDLGLLGGFTIPAGAAAGPARALPVGGDAAGAARLPDRAAVASGDYPMWYFLYICHREDATVEAAMLVTHFTSARGQRRIERIGFLPARRILREIRLRRDSPNR